MLLVVLVVVLVVPRDMFFSLSRSSGLPPLLLPLKPPPVQPKPLLEPPVSPLYSLLAPPVRLLTVLEYIFDHFLAWNSDSRHVRRSKYTVLLEESDVQVKKKHFLEPGGQK